MFNPTFIDDVLKIVNSGPARENPSIIDISGIFRIPMPGVTIESDIHLVKDMVKSYLKDERTIILAVVPANVDIARQEILSVCVAGSRPNNVLTIPQMAYKWIRLAKEHSQCKPFNYPTKALRCLIRANLHL